VGLITFTIALHQPFNDPLSASAFIISGIGFIYCITFWLIFRLACKKFHIQKNKFQFKTSNE